MKKIKNFLKKNYKIIIAFIIGIILSGTGVYAATILYAATQVGFDNTTANLKIVGTNNDVTNVQEALDALYDKASSLSGGNGQLQLDYIPPSGCSAPTLQLGDYVSITPTSSSFSIAPSITGYSYKNDKTINPRELTLWRVIKVNSCNVEVVSEYVSSTGIGFEGIVGYRNFVGILNIIATAYENPTYTVGSRMIGFDGQTEIIKNISAFDGSTNTAPSTTTTASPTSGTGQEYQGGVLGDTLYLKDYLLVGNVYKSDTSTYGSSGLKAYNVSSTSSAGAYWLASRGFYWYSASHFYFGGRLVIPDGSIVCNNFRVFQSGWRDIHSGYPVRPILTLKSGITTNGGSGTKTDPYTLS